MSYLEWHHGISGWLDNFSHPRRFLNFFSSGRTSELFPIGKILSLLYIITMRKKDLRHNIMLVLLGGLLTIILAIGFGVIELPWLNQGSPVNITRDEGSANETQNSVNSIQPVLDLQSDDPYIRPAFDGSESLTEDEYNNIQVYQMRNEAVVNVSTEVISYSLFFEPVPQEGSTGSGSIIDTRGYVLTNVHVIEDAVAVYVTLSDGERVEAEIVGSDPENDLAVLKFDPGDRDLQTIPLGDSSELRVGQKVLAIGNPFSFDRTLTTGVISGLGRPIQNSNGTIIQGMIQTDASINPGNSGGPLLNSSGNLIGVNTMIYSPSGGSVGVGFAVPINTVRRVLPDLLEFGQVNRGWIDINPIQLFPELVSYADLPVERGILISRIDSGGEAAEAGLRGGSRNNAVRYGNTIIYLGGDIIVEIDGTPTYTIAHLYEALEDNRPGDVVDVVYYRGGRRRETQVELIKRPEQFLLN